MRTNKTVYQAGALILMLALLCGCGKKGRLYIPGEQNDAAEPSTHLSLVSVRT